MKYKRILLKLSGEALMGNQKYGIDSNVLSAYAQDINSIVNKGVELAIVIGGGNIYRGVQSEESGFDRVQGDHMGMQALFTILFALVVILSLLIFHLQIQILALRLFLGTGSIMATHFQVNKIQIIYSVNVVIMILF